MLTKEDLKYDDTNVLDKPLYSKKYICNVGSGAPAYDRYPKFEECFALNFLKKIYKEDYENIKLHDIQIKTNDKERADSLDLLDKTINIGVEVVQAINPDFRKEEAKWNKPLSLLECPVKKDELIHYWKNRPTSLEIIKNSIIDKDEKYLKYKEKYPDVKDIDLFVYVVDVIIPNGKTLFGKWNDNGSDSFIDFCKNGLKPLLEDLKPQYRYIYFVFGNYFYRFDRKFNYNIYQLPLDTLNDLNEKTISLHNYLKDNINLD